MAAIVEAGEASPMFAALDIYDLHGTTLWAARQSVLPLQEKLLAREMRFRIRQLQREIALRCSDLPDSETAPIYKLEDMLAESGAEISTEPLAAASA